MPVEGVVDRLRRLSEVKDGRGLKQLIVDTVAPPASDRLIGHVEIPLRDLPACGSNTWWSLYKMDGKVKKERGEIHLIQHLFIREGRLKEHTRSLICFKLFNRLNSKRYKRVNDHLKAYCNRCRKLG
jgi:hypothetical protein